MVSFLKSIVAVALGVALGLAATFFAVERGMGLGAVRVGPWTGWPKTGSRGFEEYWDYAKRHQIPTHAFYAAYPDLSVGRIRQLQRFKRAFDELVARLRDLRPEWPWKEALAPLPLRPAGDLRKLTEPGIYNAAIVVIADRSPFTVGLERDLSDLQRVSEGDITESSLGALVGKARASESEEIGRAHV